MFGTVGDFTVFVRSVPRFRDQSVIIFFKDCLNVPLHGDVSGRLFVIPMKVDAGVLISFPVIGDDAVLSESDKEVFGVAFLHILNAKIIDYE